MTKQTAQPAVNIPGTVDQPQTRTSVVELTTLLQEVNKLFPPIKGKLADGRTREGRQQREHLARREAYIKALTAAVDHATVENRLRQEMDLVMAGHETDRNASLGQIKMLRRFLAQTGPFMLVAFQLGLLIQRRPEIVTPREIFSTTNEVNFNLGDLKVTLYGDNQYLRLTAQGLRSELFTFDNQGNLLGSDLDRLIGYLTRAGYTIDPENAKKTMSASARAAAYTDSTSKLGAMAHAFGRIAMTGAGWDLEPDLTIARSKPLAAERLADAIRIDDDFVGANLRKDPHQMPHHLFGEPSLSMTPHRGGTKSSDCVDGRASATDMHLKVSIVLTDGATD